MNYFDNYGVEFSEDKKTLIRCPEYFEGSYAIPDIVTTIGICAFEGCSKLTAIDIPNSVIEINGGAFKDCTGLTSIKIPDSVRRIDDWAFRGCLGLTSVEIPNYVTWIGDWVFEGCLGLTSIDIPNNITDIPDSAFAGCTGLVSIIIPNSVTHIGPESFFGCTNLQSIVIPESVTEIDNCAFCACEGLSLVKIPKSVTMLGNDVFTDIGPQLAVYVDENNVSYCDIDGAIFTKDQQELLHYHYKKGTREDILPKLLRTIRHCAFEGVTLKKLVINTGLEHIEKEAFWCTHISNITIPNTIKSIGSKAFYENELKELHLQHEYPEEIEVDDDAFEGTAEKCTLYVPSGAEEAYRSHPVFGQFKEIIPENIS